MSEHNLGGGNHLNLQSTKMVKLSDSLTLKTNEVWVELDITISADFNTIPDEYHEVFTNMLTSRYMGRVSYMDNPFSKCHLPPKKWWQFWK